MESAQHFCLRKRHVKVEQLGWPAGSACNDVDVRLAQSVFQARPCCGKRVAGALLRVRIGANVGNHDY